MHLATRELVDVAEQVFQSLVRMPVVLQSDGAALRGDLLIGSVAINGAFCGTLTVTLPLGLAQQVADALFHDANAGTRVDDLADAVRELANQLAGGVKSFVPQPSYLDVPSAFFAVEAAASDRPGRRVAAAVLACADDVLEIAVFEGA